MRKPPYHEIPYKVPDYVRQWRLAESMKYEHKTFNTYRRPRRPSDPLLDDEQVRTLRHLVIIERWTPENIMREKPEFQPYMHKTIIDAIYGRGKYEHVTDNIPDEIREAILSRMSKRRKVNWEGIYK